MQNLIVFETVTNSDGKFWSERQKKLKSKANFIRADEFTFHKIKVFLMKNSPFIKLRHRSRRRKGGDAEFNCL